jgi:hypothetical protein
VENVDIQRALLEVGIQRTHGAVERSKEAAVFPSTPKETKEGEGEGAENLESSERVVVEHQIDTLVAHFRCVPADAQLCHMRAVLLERLDRLNTFVEICREVPDKEDEVEDDIEEWEDDPWAGGTAESSPTVNVAASGSTEPQVMLSTFLTGGLLRISCLLASQQWFGALRVLFQRHGPYLWAYRFTILESIPEHAHPSKYLHLLPTFDPITNAEQTLVSDPWRPELDWTETLQAQAAVEVSGVPLGVEFPSEHIPDELTSQHEPLTTTELTNWYQRRVNGIISTTGMVDIALSTIQHGASQGLPGLDELGEELSLLSRLVYDAPKGDELDDEADDWTLSRWKRMDPPAVIRAYLAHSTPDSLAKDITRLVMPYLFVLESRAERAGAPDPGLPNRLLYDYILSAPLEMAAVVFEASKPTLPPAQRIIRNDEEVARLALACLYGSDSLTEWPTMSRIFECMPVWDISGEDESDEDAAETTIVSLGAYVTPSTNQSSCSASDLLLFFNPLPMASLSRALDILDVHLESGEILSRWSVPAPLRWFLQSHNDATTQRAWANRMARRAGGSTDKLNTIEDWEWLLEDMLKLCGTSENGLKGAFGLLPRDEIVRIFFSGLLSTGKFSVAKELLRSSKTNLELDSAVIEDICLTCSREFYDNASSGNSKFGEMKLAYECLDVPPPSEQLTKEKEFIEATSRLSTFKIMSRPGIPISPIEIRLTKDRLSLVSQVLSSNADAYKHTQVILDLVQKLGFRDDIVAEVKTLAMLVETALQAEDFVRAYETSERMVSSILELRDTITSVPIDPKIQEASEVCWLACFQLGRHPEFDDIQKKLSLLGRALELCPPDKLHDVLNAWQRLEKEDIDNRRERLAARRSGTAVSAPQKRPTALTSAGASLAARLQDFRMPAAPLLNTPDAAALASRTFSRVAANFPFSVGSRGRSLASENDTRSRSGSGSRMRSEVEDVSTQASRVLQKGLGWLIGADDE